jgi:hypothetical protein
MKKPRPKTYALGYWANNTTPDLSLALRSHINEGTFDLTSFTAWLGDKLADYRGGEEVRAQLAKPAEEVAYLDGLQRQLARAQREAEATLHSLYEPPQAGARLVLAAYQLGLDWSAKRDGLRMTLLEMVAVVDRALVAAKKKPTKLGRPKSASPRDRLVAEVVAKLTHMAPNVKAEARLQTAQKVLTMCGVHGLSDVKRAARQGQK